MPPPPGRAAKKAQGRPEKEKARHSYLFMKAAKPPGGQASSSTQATSAGSQSGPTDARAQPSSVPVFPIQKRPPAKVFPGIGQQAPAGFHRRLQHEAELRRRREEAAARQARLKEKRLKEERAGKERELERLREELQQRKSHRLPLELYQVPPRKSKETAGGVDQRKRSAVPAGAAGAAAVSSKPVGAVPIKKRKGAVGSQTRRSSHSAAAALPVRNRFWIDTGAEEKKTPNFGGDDTSTEARPGRVPLGKVVSDIAEHQRSHNFGSPVKTKTNVAATASPAPRLTPDSSFPKSAKSTPPGRRARGKSLPVKTAGNNPGGTRLTTKSLRLFDEQRRHQARLVLRQFVAGGADGGDPEERYKKVFKTVKWHRFLKRSAMNRLRRGVPLPTSAQTTDMIDGFWTCYRETDPATGMVLVDEETGDAGKRADPAPIPLKAQVEAITTRQESPLNGRLRLPPLPVEPEEVQQRVKAASHRADGQRELCSGLAAWYLDFHKPVSAGQRAATAMGYEQSDSSSDSDAEVRAMSLAAKDEERASGGRRLPAGERRQRWWTANATRTEAYARMWMFLQHRCQAEVAVDEEGDHRDSTSSESDPDMSLSSSSGSSANRSSSSSGSDALASRPASSRPQPQPQPKKKQQAPKPKAKAQVRKASKGSKAATAGSDEENGSLLKKTLRDDPAADGKFGFTKYICHTAGVKVSYLSDRVFQYKSSSFSYADSQRTAQKGDKSGTTPKPKAVPVRIVKTASAPPETGMRLLMISARNAAYAAVLRRDRLRAYPRASGLFLDSATASEDQGASASASASASPQPAPTILTIAQRWEWNDGFTNRDGTLPIGEENESATEGLEPRRRRSQSLAVAAYRKAFPATGKGALDDGDGHSRTFSGQTIGNMDGIGPMEERRLQEQRAGAKNSEPQAFPHAQRIRDYFRRYNPANFPPSKTYCFNLSVVQQMLVITRDVGIELDSGLGIDMDMHVAFSHVGLQGPASTRRAAMRDVSFVSGRGSGSGSGSRTVTLRCAATELPREGLKFCRQERRLYCSFVNSSASDSACVLPGDGGPPLTRAQRNIWVAALRRISEAAERRAAKEAADAKQKELAAEKRRELLAAEKQKYKAAAAKAKKRERAADNSEKQTQDEQGASLKKLKLTYAVPLPTASGTATRRSSVAVPKKASKAAAAAASKVSVEKLSEQKSKAMRQAVKVKKSAEKRPKSRSQQAGSSWEAALEKQEKVEDSSEVPAAGGGAGSAALGLANIQGFSVEVDPISAISDKPRGYAGVRGIGIGKTSNLSKTARGLGAGLGFVPPVRGKTEQGVDVTYTTDVRAPGRDKNGKLVKSILTLAKKEAHKKQADNFRPGLHEAKIAAPKPTRPRPAAKSAEVTTTVVKQAEKKKQRAGWYVPGLIQDDSSEEREPASAEKRRKVG